MTKPFKLMCLNVDAVRAMPDGDYTVGRGADPRSAAERASDPDGSVAVNLRKLAQAELDRKKADERLVRAEAAE
jgi:hypothetical protein